MTGAVRACDDGDMWRVPVSRARLNDYALTLLFFALGLALYATGLGLIGQDLAADLPAWTCLITLAVAACFQLFRSSHPGVALAGVTLALIVDAATVPSIAVWLVFSDIVYATCVYGGPRLVRGLYAVAGIVSVATFLLVTTFAGSDWRLIFICLLWLMALVGSPLAYGLAVREHRNALVLERAHSRTLADLAEREQIEAVADEHRRLARELHDVIAGRLSAITVQSAAALQYPEDTALAGKALQSVRSSSVEALSEMRGLIDLLSDGTDHSAPDGRVTAGLRRIDRLIEPIAESGTDIDVDVPDSLTAAAGTDELAPVVDIAAYRIVAEALSNAVTHAPGQPIWVAITYDTEKLRLCVRNRLSPHRGRTGGDTGHTGRGLGNMHTRAHTVGGILHAEPDGDEFVVEATLPATGGTSVGTTTPKEV
ncbi:sensor histidine kinase [Gordonia sp. DT219]|uniref:sensor histidine kinase n=1 Tax=Gordonia sp. DT219 TaxID=3416658 RepID=UPI003CF5832B